MALGWRAKIAKLVKKHGGGAGSEADAMAVTQSGEALAVGAASRADGEVIALGREGGKVSMIGGKAKFAAYAEGPNSSGEIAAGASVVLEADGADILFTRTRIVHGSDADGALTVVRQKYVAIDIAGWEPANGPLGRDVVKIIERPHSKKVGAGHLAEVDAQAVALGPDTYAVTATASAAGVDGYSIVAAAAGVGIA